MEARENFVVENNQLSDREPPPMDCPTVTAPDLNISTTDWDERSEDEIPSTWCNGCITCTTRDILRMQDGNTLGQVSASCSRSRQGGKKQKTLCI